MSTEKKTENNVKDDDLDELLDSALEDFDKVATKPKDEPSTSSEKFDDPPMESMWNEEFIQQQSKMFENQMKEIFGAVEGNDKDVSPEQLSLGFKRIAEAAAMAIDPSSSAEVPQIDPAFSKSIADVLKGLSEGQENLQQPFNADDISSMFGNINLSESGENNAFLPFMQGMMQSLLSAEVLLPSLKEIVSKYPAWLEENGSKVPAEDKERYEKQLKLMREVCGELEKEKADDSADVKKDRFTIVLDRMQKMQELGQPPAELVGEASENLLPNFAAGADGALANGEQCSVM